LSLGIESVRQFGPRVRARAELADQADHGCMVRVDIEKNLAARAAAADSPESVQFRSIPGVFMAAAFPPDGADLKHWKVLFQNAMLVSALLIRSVKQRLGRPAPPARPGYIPP
jgi:hypothetical protein